MDKGTKIIFRDKTVEEILKEGFLFMGDPGMLTFETPIELFTPIKEKLEEAVREANPGKKLETDDYAVFYKGNKKTTGGERFHYTVYALEKIHQKP